MPVANPVIQRGLLQVTAALAAGASMINDVSALGHDPDALAVAAKADAPIVLMHARGDPRTMQADTRYDCAPLDVFDGLERRIAGSPALWQSSRVLSYAMAISASMNCTAWCCAMGTPKVLRSFA